MSSGAGTVVFRWQSVDLSPQRPLGACSVQDRGRLAPRLFCACASQAGPLGVKGVGVLRSGSVLEPEGDVAPPSGPSGARTRLIINSPPLVEGALHVWHCVDRLTRINFAAAPEDS